jgi:hypothetical protein
MKTEFHRILREKLFEDPQNSRPKSVDLAVGLAADLAVDLTVDSEPRNLAFLLGTIEKKHFSRGGFLRGKIPGLPIDSKDKTILWPNAYLQPNKPQPNKVTSSPSPAPAVTLPVIPPVMPTAPAHLTNRQKEGWLWFWKKGLPLSPSFTKGELQKQFRKLALLLHPDQNTRPKAAQSYMQLREHYHSLIECVEESQAGA